MVIVPKVPVYSIAGISKTDQTQYEQFSADFARNRPKIIMVVDYIVNNVKIGNLILFHKYKTASHYEVFKKNLFAEISTFQRTLFLDSHSLAEETEKFETYIRDHIGMDNLTEGSYYAVMDSLIKEDRIYEYKICASVLPNNSREVDYDYILESKKLISAIPIDSLVQRTLAQFSISTLGSKQLGWVVALLNKRLQFFNTTTLTTPISQLMSPDTTIIFPKNVNDIKRIMDDSVSLFGLDSTIDHLLGLLGGLSVDFKDSFDKSLNRTDRTFVYATFIASIRSKVPVFSLLLTVSEHTKNSQARERLSKLNLVLPPTPWVDPYTSIEGLSKIFDFVNSIIFLVTRSQEESSALSAILAELNAPAPVLAPPVTKLPPLVKVATSPLPLPVKPATVLPKSQPITRFPGVSDTLNNKSGLGRTTNIFIKPR
jgi:hypothetical protein